MTTCFGHYITPDSARYGHRLDLGAVDTDGAAALVPYEFRSGQLAAVCVGAVEVAFQHCRENGSGGVEFSHVKIIHDGCCLEAEAAADLRQSVVEPSRRGGRAFRRRSSHELHGLIALGLVCSRKSPLVDMLAGNLGGKDSVADEVRSVARSDRPFGAVNHVCIDDYEIIPPPATGIQRRCSGKRWPALGVRAQEAEEIAFLRLSYVEPAGHPGKLLRPPLRR